MNGSKLWLICKGRIIGWTLPDLVPLETYLEQTCALIPPEFEISLEAPSKTFGRLTKPSCLSSMNWYNNVDTTPLTFFDLVWKTRGRDRISTFPLECLHAEDLPTTTVKSKQTLSIPGLENQDNQGIYNLISRDTRRSGDFYIKSIYSSKTRCCYLVVSSGPTKTRRAHGLKDFRVMLPLKLPFKHYNKNTENFRRGDFYDAVAHHIFDPISGRACTVAEKRDEYYVWNYLPSEKFKPGEEELMLDKRKY